MSDYNYILSIVSDPNAVIYIRDLEGRYLWVNDVFEQELHLLGKDIYGKTNREIYGAKASERWEVADALAIKQQAPVVAQEFLYDEHLKRMRTFVSMKSTFEDTNGETRLLGVSVELASSVVGELAERVSRLRAEAIILKLKNIE